MIFSLWNNIFNNRTEEGKNMYQEDYLFFPEAQTVDKLLSLFNIQSQETLNPDKMISILGLLNLLNIVSVANDSGSASLSNLVNSSSSNGENNINSQQINQLMQTLNNSQSTGGNNSTVGTEDITANNPTIQSVLSMLNNKGGNSNQLDPTLLLKVMNLFNQLRNDNQTREEEETETNEPVKSEPYEEEEE